jgi:hypothetical protein
MDNSQFSPRLITSLNRLAQLSQLELGWASLTEAASYLMPLLAAIGGRLTHLSLENLEDCDILRLGRLCPRLISLKLSAFLTVVSKEPATSEERCSLAFPHLEEVHLFNSREAFVSSRVIRELLGHLRVAYFQNLTLSWDELLVQSALNHLESVSFENCTELSLACLIQLLRLKNPLGKIKSTFY